VKRGPATTRELFASRSSRAATAEPVLLYDGLCGVCNSAVRFILARDPVGGMRFAALQGAFAERLFARHPALRSVDSLLLVRHSGAGDEEQVSVRSEAVMEIGHYLGGIWRLASGVLRLVPRTLRDWSYDAFARRRDRLSRRYDSCPIPAPEVRARFID